MAAAALEATVLPVREAGAPGPAAGRAGDLRDYKQRYQKYELIGQGAQKKVYRAFDEERGIEVAWNEVAVAELARFREKYQQRVFAEIRVLKQLKHKNIMALHDYWYDEKRLMLIFITEIFPDGTLRQYRRRHKHADLPAIKHWAWQILQGLVYLHGHNPPIIHRDLKCDNIFVAGSTGVVKIGDLGLVTLCKDLSAPQSVLGTPEFMAPELYEEKYDEKVDVYAFGMCLLELATMEYPYSECKNAAQIYKKVTQGIPPASVEKLASEELREFIKLCLRHDPNQRPEARQLLKHSFFEPIRAAAAAACAGGSAGGAPSKLGLSPSRSLAAGAAAEATLAAAASASAAASVSTSGAGGEALSPPYLSRTVSLGRVSSGGRSGGGGASADGTPVPTPALLGSIAAALGGGLAAGGGAAAAAPAPMGSIAMAATGGGEAAMAAGAGPVPLAQLRHAVSLGPAQGAPLGAIAAALIRQESLGSAAAAAAAAPAAAAAAGGSPLERSGSGESSGSGEACRSSSSSTSSNVLRGTGEGRAACNAGGAAAAGGEGGLPTPAAAAAVAAVGPIAAALQAGSYGAGTVTHHAAAHLSSIAAATTAATDGVGGGAIGGALPPPLTLGGLGLGPGSIAAALSPTRNPSNSHGAAVPPRDVGCPSSAIAAAAGGRSSLDSSCSSSASALTAALSHPQQQQQQAGSCQSPQSPLSPVCSAGGSAPGGATSLASEFAAAWGEPPALPSESSPFRLQPPAASAAPHAPGAASHAAPSGGSPTDAAAAAAAVHAPAVSVPTHGAGPGPGSLTFHSHGGVLPSICEDNELHEDMLFGNEENSYRQNRALTVEDDESEDGEAGGECGEGGAEGSGPMGRSAEGSSPAASGGCGGVGSRSQPVNLQVRSSGQAAVTNMALSFAMSFTNSRGMRKKVGFQYDLVHDTASAIAVEMVENLSLNTAEAEAIAAMIQHEVSRFNQRQQQQQPQ